MAEPDKTEPQPTRQEIKTEIKKSNWIRGSGLVIIAVVLVLWGISLAIGLSADSAQREINTIILEKIEKGQKKATEELKWHHIQVQFKHDAMMKELLSVSKRLSNLEKSVKKLEETVGAE